MRNFLRTLAFLFAGFIGLCASVILPASVTSAITTTFLTIVGIAVAGYFIDLQFFAEKRRIAAQFENDRLYDQTY